MDFCNPRLNESALLPDEPGLLPALLFNGHKCRQQLAESTLPGVDIVILTKYEWSRFREDNSTFLTLLNRLTVLQIGSDEATDIEKYREKCGSVRG